MLKKMFSSDGKYYLELDDVQEKAINTATEASTEASNKTDKVVEQVETPKQELPTEVPVVKPEQKTEASKVESKVKQTPVATTSKAVSSEQPFWVAAMYSNNNSDSNNSSDNDTSSSEQTFATDNLMPTLTKFRRRPGPSLNQFRDMAKQARIRRR